MDNVIPINFKVESRESIILYIAGELLAEYTKFMVVNNKDLSNIEELKYNLIDILTEDIPLDITRISAQQHLKDILPDFINSMKSGSLVF